MQTKAMQMREALRANVDAYYAKRITYETFSAEGKRIWDAIAEAGLVCAVQSIQRNAEAQS
jgi:hypothetical protein